MPGLAVKGNHNGSVLYSKDKIQLLSAWKRIQPTEGEDGGVVYPFLHKALSKKRNILDRITADLKRSFQALRVL